MRFVTIVNLTLLALIQKEKRITCDRQLFNYSRVIMPTKRKPRFLHVLCNNTVYEQSVFSQLQMETTLQQLHTGAKQNSSISSNNISFCLHLDVTIYSSCNLHVLGDFNYLYDKININKNYPKIHFAIKSVDFKQFLSLSVFKSQNYSFLVSQNVMNWVTAEMLSRIADANCQSVFIHLGSSNMLACPSS